MAVSDKDIEKKDALLPERTKSISRSGKRSRSKSRFVWVAFAAE
jgi:hypothetical protein